MADWSALVKGFQGGAEFGQNFRANRQLEKARDQALERGQYDLESQRAFRKTTNPDAAGALGADYAAGNTDWTGQLEDPFAFKLFDWVKSKFNAKKPKRQAISTSDDTPDDSASALPASESAGPQAATPEPGDMGAVTTPYDPGYADGGTVDEDEKIRERARANRARTPGSVQNATETVQGADRTVKGASTARKALDIADKADEGAGKFLGRATEGAGKMRRFAAGAKGLGAAGLLGATAIDTATTPTEEYRQRFGLETDDPSLAGDIGVRALGAASDLGNTLTGGLAQRGVNALTGRWPDRSASAPQQALPVAQTVSEESPPPSLSLGGGGVSSTSMRQRAALPQSRATDPEVVNFGDIDIDAKDVPNMQMDDWKKYRAQMIAAAQKSGSPQAVAQVNDMVTDMQQKGFLSYGQQGLALQQAGNIRAAMAAYRAAFQYFPNGNDVEFGIHKDRKTGRSQIVGFGKDEKTGKVVKGSEMIMDPERTAALLENFKNPQAFRMWTKDWRDFQQEQRKYEEVTKPLAQAQADYMANNSEANMLRAENAGLRAGGAGGAGVMRNAERVFRERLTMMGLQDETQADYLASVMSQVKAANPQVPDNTIVQVIMQSASDGSLPQRLQRMGIGGAAPAAQGSAGVAPPSRTAIPAGVDPNEWNSAEMQDLPYDERVQATTPAR